jgi:DNA-binding NarL/FixJ family response regulator
VANPGIYRPESRKLTRREAEVLELLVTEGPSNPEMGLRLGITEETVKRHLFKIMNKTGYSTRLELAVRTLQKRAEEKKLEPPGHMLFM